MHRRGPELFGSSGDASIEQLAAWTRWSEAASRMELERIGGVVAGQAPSRPGSGVDTR
jgi:hypothetical protein